MARSNPGDDILGERGTQRRALEHLDHEACQALAVTGPRRVASATLIDQVTGSGDTGRHHWHPLCDRFLNDAWLPFPPARMHKHIEGRIERSHVRSQSQEGDAIAK